jgi:hypothetical protein
MVTDPAQQEPQNLSAANYRAVISSGRMPFMKENVNNFQTKKNSMAFSPQKLYRLIDRHWSANFSANCCG